MRIRIAARAERRWAAPLAGILLALTVGLSAGPAWADAVPAPQQAEVCAPGAMTITRGGPTVYDGVDCTPGAHAGQVQAPAQSQAQSNSGDTVVPSATVL